MKTGRSLRVALALVCIALAVALAALVEAWEHSPVATQVKSSPSSAKPAESIMAPVVSTSPVPPAKPAESTIAPAVSASSAPPAKPSVRSRAVPQSDPFGGRIY